MLFLLLIDFGTPSNQAGDEFSNDKPFNLFTEANRKRVKDILKKLEDEKTANHNQTSKKVNILFLK